MLRNAILLVCFFASTIVMAQKPSVLVGLKAGYLHSSFSFSNFPSDYSKPQADEALYVGINADVPLSKRISLMPEVLFTAVPGVQSYNDHIGLIHDEFSHVLFPLLFKYKIGKLGVVLGPQADILVSAKGYYLSKDSLYDPISNAYYFTIEHGDIKNDSYRKLSISGVIGAEYVFRYRFGIEARYEQGITDFRASNGSSVLTKYGSIHHSALQAGVFFRFGKKPGKVS